MNPPLAAPRFPQFSRSDRWLAAMTLVAGIVPVLAGVARAATYTWTPTAAGTAYNWDNAGSQNNWTSGFPNLADDVANLNINLAGAQTINLNQAITVATINLGDTGSTYYGTTIAAGIAGSLIMDVGFGPALISKATAGNTAADLISANIQLNDSLTVTNAATAAGGALTLSGNVTEGSAGMTLTKNGAGMLILSGNNSYTGDTTISAGILRANNNAGLPGLASSGGGSNLNLAGGVFETGANLERAGGAGQGQMQITGGNSGFSANGAAVQVAFGSIASPDALTWGAAPFAPAILVLNASTANNTIDFKNAIDLNGSARTVQVDAAVANTATLSGILSGTGGGLTKAGTGALVLSNANTYSGPTAVNAGTLQLTNTNAVASSSGVTMVNATALQLRSDATATFNAPLVTVSTTGTSSATIDVNNNGSGSGNTLTLSGGLWSSQNHGNVTTFNVTGGNGYTLRVPTLTVDRFGSGGTGGGLTLNPTTASFVADAVASSVSQTVVLTLGGTSTGNSVGAISNSGANLSLTKSGASTWTLTGVNGYKGSTTVSGGTLALGIAGAIPSTSAVTVSAGTLDLANFDQTLSAATALTMGGTASVTPAVTTGTGTLTLGGNVTYSATNNGLGSTITGKLSLGGAERTFTVGDSTNAAEDMAISANISGAYGLIKAGAGTLVLSGANTYAGDTVVNAGALQFNTLGAIGGSGRNVFVHSGVVQFGALSDTDIATAMTRITTASAGAISPANNTAGALDFNTAGLASASFGVATAMTYTGTLTPYASAYRVGGGTATLTIGSNLGDSGGATSLTKVGTDTVILSGTNGFTGATRVLSGTLQYNSLAAIGSTSAVNPSSGAIIALGYDAAQTALIPLTGNTNAFSVALAANVTNDLDFSAATGANLSNASLGATGAFTYSGTLTPNGTTYRLGGGGGTLTFNPGSYVSGNDLAINGSGRTGNVDFAGQSRTFGAVASSGGTIQNGTLTGTSFGIDAGTVSAVLAGSGAGLTKATTGTLTLNGAAVNTYTGATTVNWGTLIVDFANLTPATNLIDGNSALVMGSGTLQVKQKSATVTSQTFAGTTINAGSSTITATNVSGSATNTLTVALGAITRNAGGVVNFTLPTSGQGAIATSTANDASGFLGRWATTGLTTSLQYAANNGSGNIIAYAGATAATTGTLANVTSATKNYSFAAAATIPAASALTGNTLRYTGAAAALEIGSDLNSTNTLTLNGLMQAGSGALTVQRTGTGATGGLVIGSNNELVLITNNQAMTISAPIMNNGVTPGAVTFASYGGGALTLSGNSNFSGGLTIASGTVNTSGPLASGSDQAVGSGTITMLPGTTLALSRSMLANAFNMTDAMIQTSNSFGSIVSGNITVSGIATIMNNNGNGNIAYTGNISGTGGILHLGPRQNSVITTLSGTNTYQGTTTIGPNAALEFANPLSLYSGDTSKWTADNLIVQSGGTAWFNVGTGGFSSSNINTIVTLGTATGGFTNGTNIGFDTGGGTFTYAGAIASTNGGANKLGVNKFGTGTLELSGSNTYTGSTFVTNGSIRVTSLNSVVGGSASSSLGAPTTVADGTITLGYYSNGYSGTLIYAGNGETTDRVIAIGSGTGGSTINQSGNGLLKFTSDLTTLSTGKPLTLTGSTSGTGEISGAIPGSGNTLTKSGTGTWTLSGNNAYAGVTTVNAGALVLKSANALPGGIGATGGTSALTFNGGVLGLGAGDFTRSLAAAGTVTGANFTGNGGWAAYGANRAVNLGGNATPDTIAWATANTGFNAKTLILGAATATHTVDLQNPIDLGNVVRTVQVDNGGAAIDAKMSGLLSNSSGGGLTKTGAGTLLLTGANTYDGTTKVQTGALLIGGALSGAGSTLVDVNASLTADSIVQDTLTINAGGSVTIREVPFAAGGAGGANAVPEPATWALIGIGLLSLLAFRRRR
jgi:autotransporter-associated beta strand protein